jgi:hypothetical protein
VTLLQQASVILDGDPALPYSNESIWRSTMQKNIHGFRHDVPTMTGRTKASWRVGGSILTAISDKVPARKQGLMHARPRSTHGTPALDAWTSQA